MTEQELPVLDGEALTREAFWLGLAPTGTREDSTNPGTFTSYAVWWEPHRMLAQADVVLRQLRAHGWSTIVEWRREEASGYVAAYYPGVDRIEHAVHVEWDTVGGRPEAEALLLCAVLAARAREEREE